MTTTNFSLLQSLIVEAEVKPFDRPLTAPMRELVGYALSNCSKAVEDFRAGKYLYRGWSQRISNGLYNPGSGTRKSDNTSNWYTLFFDTNPANADFPKRSKSFICTDSKHVAEEFSSDGLSYVFPFDSAEIGVFPTGDLWSVEVPFRTADYPLMMNDLNGGLDAVSKEFGTAWSSFDEFIEDIKTLSPDDLDFVNSTSLKHIGIGNLPQNEQVKTYVEFFEKAYDLREIGADVISQVSEASNFGGSDEHELWFSRRCVVIKAEDIEQFRSLLR